MTVTLSTRVGRVKPSPTLAVTAKAAELRAQGLDVLSLGAGEPDFDTPDHIKAAAEQALRDGKTKYTPVGGTPAMKNAIVTKMKRDNALDYTPAEVVAATGGKQACYNLCQALLDDGDEAIVPAPYWVSYPDMVLLAGGQPVVVETTMQQRFKMSPDALRRAITPKTKLLWLNSPSNPSGMAYTRDELAALGKELLDHPGIVIASDDMYEKILWADEPYANIINAVPELKDRTVVIHAVSKTYSMTGWRLGWACGPEPIIKAMSKIQSQSTSNPCSISQVAAQAALEGDQQCVADMRATFKRRHDRLVTALDAIEGIHCVPGDGTFYVFPDVTGLIRKLGCRDDLEFAERALQDAQVALVPGTAFGTPGHVRLSFAASDEVLAKAVERLATLAA